jgi:pimeloyl-ACP methyl ester carboxylesterase
MADTIYKSPKYKNQLETLYQSKLDGLNFPYEAFYVDTPYGKTHIIECGKKHAKPLIIFHGVHAGSALTLDCIQDLTKDYHLYAIDTIGQATRSAETRINIKDDSFAIWADSVFEALELEQANVIGISYGAYLVQKLITHKPHRVNKAIMVVPSGLANGDFWPSFKKLSLPLIKYQITKKDKDLRKFLEPFVPADDDFMFEFQKLILQGLHMDYRRPSILQAKDVKDFKNPVYLMVADNDIFFPGEKAIKQAKKVFPNLKGIHVLKNCKHMPHVSHFDEMQDKIKEWLN